MRALLVVNPHSRSGRRFGDTVCAELERHGVEPVREARAPGAVDALVAAGGDGTVARCIGTALGYGVPLGVVPLGTFNDLAHTLRIPFDVGRACATIAAGRTRTIDVARVNDAYYVSEASVGISSRIARLQRERDKRRFGLLAIAASALGAVRHMRPFHAEIAYDGHRDAFKTMQLTVANSSHFGGFITVDDAALDDGTLELYSVEIDSVARFLSVAKTILSGRRHPARGLRTYRAAAFEVVTRRSHRITADGEPAGTTPARFAVLPSALRVFVPSEP